jgi:hypothetical protein
MGGDLEEQLPRVSDPTELELSQALQAEESRWSALITRLEALTQR